MSSLRQRWFPVVVFLVLSSMAVPVQGQSRFLRGDVNCDGCVSLTDAYELAQIVTGILVPPCNCPEGSDANDDDVLNIADVAHLAAFLTIGGPPPTFPFPGCGLSLTPGVLACPAYPPCPLFKRGDADCDGCVSAQDAAFLANFLALGGAAPCCDQAADANDDDLLNTADTVFILAYCSQIGPAPPAPGPLTCGPDPTPGTLSCNFYSPGACCRGCKNQLPGDCNGDGTVDISDPVCLFGFCFLGTPSSLPCGDGTKFHPSNIALMDCNGDNRLDCVTDGIWLLRFLFGGGPPPAGGTGCVYIEKCPQNQACAICTP